MSARPYTRRGCCYCGCKLDYEHINRECPQSRHLLLPELNKLLMNRCLGTSADALIAHLGWQVETKERT